MANMYDYEKEVEFNGVTYRVVDYLNDDLVLAIPKEAQFPASPVVIPRIPS